MKDKGWERYEPVIARSRMRSSELGARSHSARSTFWNSLPITGVTSNFLYPSKAPLSFRGSLWTLGLDSPVEPFAVFRGVESRIGWVIVSTDTGAITVGDWKNCEYGSMNMLNFAVGIGPHRIDSPINITQTRGSIPKIHFSCRVL